MRRKGFFEFRQFTIDQRHAAMKVGTDSDLLGTLSEGGKRILDIGTGTGVLSLMLAQRYPEARITAIEIDDNAVIDAQANFANSKFNDRIELIHDSFQNYLHNIRNTEHDLFDSVVCNPPYFDESLECPDDGRTRARHSSSLPFETLIEGAYVLLSDGGVFSVCIPGEVLKKFITECQIRSFSLKDILRIQTLPTDEPKRFVLVFKKGECTCTEHNHCMLNADSTRSDWYRAQMRDFLTI